MATTAFRLPAKRAILTTTIAFWLREPNWQSSSRFLLVCVAVPRTGSLHFIKHQDKLKFCIPPSFPLFLFVQSLRAFYNTQLVIAGDFNLHLEDPSLPASTEFRTIIDQFGLVQHVTEPTYKAGGWLDLVLTLIFISWVKYVRAMHRTYRDNCSPSDVRVYSPTFFDH